MASNWKLTNRVWHANLGMLSAITLGLVALSCPVIAHKWEAGKFLEDIHYGKFLPPQTRWIWIDGQGFLLAFLIVSGLLMHRKSVKKAASTAADDPAVAGSSVTVFGLGADAPVIALTEAAEKAGLRAFRAAPDALASLDLSQERWLILPHAGEADAVRLSALTECVAGMKKGSLKRLEFALEPGLAEKAAGLVKALAVAGAKAIRLPDPDAPWAQALVTHLVAQSPTLRARQAKPAPRPASAPAVTAAPAFTVLEVLISVVVLTFIVSITASGFQSLKRQDGVHEAAMDFAQVLRDARQMARRQNTLIRVALVSPALKDKLAEYGLEETDLKAGCGVYAFRVPANQLEPVAFTRPTAAHESAAHLRETAPLIRVPLPRSLIGGWTLAAGQRSWQRWREHVWLGGPVLDRYLESDFEAFAKDLLHQPDSVWSEERDPDETRASPFSIYPPQMDRTPYRALPRPVTAALPESERVRLDDGTQIPAREIWGDSPVLRWPQNDALALPLPALDFTPEGRLACVAQEQLEFHFSPGPGRQPVYRVIIRSRDGEVHIE